MYFDSDDMDSIEVREDTLLAYFVRTITDESALVPRGSILKLCNGNSGNRSNMNFKGLNPSEVMNMKNYQLFRKPQSSWNTNLLERADLNLYTDYLDTVDSVLPSEHSFSLSYDSNDKIVYIHSLLWMGMHFFHECNTQKYGFVYFGNGRKNFNLIFML